MDNPNSPSTNFETEIIKYQAMGLDTTLNLKIDQLEIIAELNSCLAALFEIPVNEIQQIVSISLFEYQRDTGLDLSYLSNALPQERILHVGKILYRLQNTLTAKIPDYDEIAHIKNKIDGWFQIYIKNYATR